MTGYKTNRSKQPLDAAALERLAIFYVGRFATTRARLNDYLTRKLRERGWTGDRPADVAALVSKLAALGYVDDAAFAAARAVGLQRRGYGDRRIGQALRGAGIEEGDSDAARENIADGGWDAAIAFARRRRIGPFAAVRAEREMREKAVGAMIRAGHSFAVARRIVDSPPGVVPEQDD